MSNMTEAERETVKQCAGVSDVERLRELMTFYERRADELVANLASVTESRDSLRRMYAAACDRIAGQSELLSRAAERRTNNE